MTGIVPSTRPNLRQPRLGKSEHPLAIDVWINAINLQVEMHLRNLYAHLLETGSLVPIVGSNPTVMDIFSRDVLAKIQRGESGWDTMVPENVAAIIKERGLFGFKDPSIPKL